MGVLDALIPNVVMKNVDKTPYENNKKLLEITAFFMGINIKSIIKNDQIYFKRIAKF